MAKTDKVYKGKFTHEEANFSEKCYTLLELFESSSDVLRAARNTLKNITYEGKVLTVKAFRIPKFAQNYCYGIAAHSKARKSYDNGMRLLNLGFNTAQPIGYFEYRSGGKLRDSYYVCEYASDTQRFDSLWNNETSADNDLIEQFAEYCYALHQQGVLHRDFNTTNLLVSKDDAETWTFSLVDLNRITWSSKLSLVESMKSLSRLPQSGEAQVSMLKHYAKVAGVEYSL